MYEQVIVRKGKKPGLQGFFYTFPNDDEYQTKDLYKPHPSLPNHWMYYGRAENIIVFSNGEKLNPITIEEIVEGHPQVKGALVVGSNKWVCSEHLLLPRNCVPLSRKEYTYKPGTQTDNSLTGFSRASFLSLSLTQRTSSRSKTSSTAYGRWWSRPTSNLSLTVKFVGN